MVQVVPESPYCGLAETDGTTVEPYDLEAAHHLARCLAPRAEKEGEVGHVQDEDQHIHEVPIRLVEGVGETA